MKIEISRMKRFCYEIIFEQLNILLVRCIKRLNFFVDVDFQVTSFVVLSMFLFKIQVLNYVIR